MENKEVYHIVGVVKFLKVNPSGKGYSVKVDNEWYNSFAGECLFKGEDMVEIEFTKKEVEDGSKVFRNIKSLKKVSGDSKETIEKTETKPQIQTPVSDPVIPTKEKVKAFEGLDIKEMSLEINKLNTIATQVFLRQSGKYDALCYLR